MLLPDQNKTRDESGFAMLVVLILITVASLLAVTLLSQGEQLDRSTFRDRKWHTALQVAESGVDRTVARLNTNYSFAGFTTAQSAPGGQYETAVANADNLGLGLGRKAITSTAYIPSKGHAKEVRRRIRVVLGPPPSLAYALYGDRCLLINNGGAPIVGDIFSNGHVTVENNTLVDGDVISSGGAVKLNPGAQIRKNGARGGNVRSGGRASDATCTGITSGSWGIQLDNGSIIEREARVQRPECATSPSSSEYGIVGGNNSKILGDARSWGLVSSQITVSGAIVRPVCELRAASVSLPQYSGYDPACCPATFGYKTDFYAAVVPNIALTLHSTVASFISYFNANKTSLKGIHLINPGAGDAATRIDMSGSTITDHFILATPGEIYRGNSGSNQPFFNNTTAPQRTVQLISLRAAPASGIDFDDNGFTVTGQPCVLFYSTGSISMKNNATVYGAVYGHRIELKNGFRIIYDKCVERSLGFGGELSVVRNIFNELSPKP